MFDLMELPNFSVTTPEGKQIKEYLFTFVQKYNRMAQEANRQITELKEKIDNGNL